MTSTPRWSTAGQAHAEAGASADEEEWSKLAELPGCSTEEHHTLIYLDDGGTAHTIPTEVSAQCAPKKPS